MGVAPLRRSAEALPIACDASNARTMAVRKYHYIFCALSPAGCYPYFTVWYFSLAFRLRKRSWRTHRMARHKRNVSDLPYAASPFSCVAFFVKVQNGCAARVSSGTEKGVRVKASRRRPGYSSVLKVRTAIISFACSRSRMSWSTPK